MMPQSCPLPVLITRPRAQSLRFAAQLTDAYGETLAPVISPLIEPVFLKPDLPDTRFGAMILSSETAAQAAAALRDAGAVVPELALCVGDQTANVARDLGFVAQSAAGDVHDLLALVLRHAADAPFVHLRGRETTGDLVSDIINAGLGAHAAIVYAQNPKPIAAAARDLLAGHTPVCLPVFSPRSARLLCHALDGVVINAPLVWVAISDAAARQIPASLASQSRVATHPDAPAMLHAIGAARFKP